MNKNGFATVVMLMVLLSAGAALSLSQEKLSSLPDIDQRLSRLHSLVVAKQSLLHYTSTYSDLYGPTGSGPGHLPCPDTDAFRISPNLAERNSPFFGDSPDPPCGSGSHAVGFLPRHVSLVDTRYAFHVEARQDIWYRLASSHVNNPLNRIVNSHVGQAREQQRTIVELVSPPDSARSEWDELTELLGSGVQRLVPRPSDNYVSVPLTERDILAVTTRRVLRWFVDTYRRSRVISCEDHGRCNAVPDAWRRCQGEDLPEHPTLLWLVASMDASSCNLPVLDNVDVSRHWFVRNRWGENISVTIDNACFATHYTNCELIRQSDHTLLLAASS